MPNFSSPIGENYSVNNFSMQEKTPIGKINLRGNIENKDFISKAGKILGMILPKETCTTSTKEKITSIWLGPNEWLIVSNEKLSKETNILDLENTLFDGISKNNLGSVTMSLITLQYSLYPALIFFKFFLKVHLSISNQVFLLIIKQHKLFFIMLILSFIKKQ